MQLYSSDCMHVCVCVLCLPSTRHHQFNFDSVGHQDAQDLFIGCILHTVKQQATLCFSFWKVMRHMCIEYSYNQRQQGRLKMCLHR